MSTMTKKRGRSDYRTAPRDMKSLEALSFVQYLTGPYLRGEDWVPDRLPPGALKIHHQARAAGGSFAKTEGGKPAMKGTFVNWLSRDDEHAVTPMSRGERLVVQDVPGVPRELVARAIAKAKEDDPAAIAVLEWRQEPASVKRRTPVAFCLEHGIKSDSTLTRRFYRAVELVVGHVCDLWRDSQ